MLPIIENKIFTVRGVRVMLDSDLAIVYGVETKNLNRAVKRNLTRFPERYAFQLTAAEIEGMRCQSGILDGEIGNYLRCQIGTLDELDENGKSIKLGRGKHRKYLPYAFTEHGAVMLASVLNSEKAIAASMQVVEAFVQLRRVLDNHTALAEKLAQLGVRVDGHDKTLAALFAEIRKIGVDENEKPQGRIGFRVGKRQK